MCEEEAFWVKDTSAEEGYDMIDITKLTDEDYGRWVVYTPGYGAQEKGRIKSWNENWIFVVYKCNFEWDSFQEYTACSTNPNDLDFVNKGTIE